MRFVIVFLIIDAIVAVVYIHSFIRTMKRCLTIVGKSASTFKILRSNPLKSLQLILMAFVPIFNVYEAYVFIKYRDDMAVTAILEARAGGV